MKATRAPLTAITLLAVLAALAALPAGAAARAKFQAVDGTATSITIAISGVRSGVVRELRYRSAGTHRWRMLDLGRTARRRVVAGLRPSTAYVFELRLCRAGRTRCGRWSAAERASTLAQTSTPTGPTTPTGPNAPVTCAVLPPDNPINQDISSAPADPNSGAYIASIGASGHLHPDFGSDPTYGIPYTVVGPNQPKVPINFTAYGDQSDQGPYPVPLDAPIEGGGQGGDQHVLVVQNGLCKLYELFNAHRSGAGWDADSGALFELSSNALRPDGWTSADAAGLPIFPLLVRYDEVQSGVISHALRFTVQHTQNGFIHPATHFASNDSNPALPPMGLRLRLKASFDTSDFHGAALVVLTALKKYGMIVADNGSNWYITGSADTRWSDDDLNQLKSVPGSAFEVVRTGAIQHNS
jgi:hypothetical protein